MPARVAFIAPVVCQKRQRGRIAHKDETEAHPGGTEDVQPPVVVRRTESFTQIQETLVTSNRPTPWSDRLIIGNRPAGQSLPPSVEKSKRETRSWMRCAATSLRQDVSSRSIRTQSTHLPNLKPTSVSTPAVLNPRLLCRPMDPWFSESPITATIR